MKVYTLTKLEELDMELPEVDVRGVYGRKSLAKEALVDWIMELMDSDCDFKDSLLRDENHEDIPGSLLSGDDDDDANATSGKIDRKAISEYISSEIKDSEGYYVWGNNNSYHFDIFERDLDIPEM